MLLLLISHRNPLSSFKGNEKHRFQYGRREDTFAFYYFLLVRIYLLVFIGILSTHLFRNL